MCLPCRQLGVAPSKRYGLGQQAVAETRVTQTGADVVIVGAGIAGISTAYYLGMAGIRSVVIEKDAVGSHASGFAFGGLGALSGSGVPGPTFPVAAKGARLHRELSEALPDQIGIDTEFRRRPAMALAFTEEEVRTARADQGTRRAEIGNTAQWVDGDEARSIEPSISPEALGGIYTEDGAEVEPYKLVLAMTQAAEGLGATVRHGRVTGLRRDGKGGLRVELDTGLVPCGRVVLAMGPWGGGASDWLDVPIQVRPLKGQILRLSAPGPPIRCSVGYAGNYAITKSDGLVWAGTTEEEAGFDEAPTSQGRDHIMGALLKMAPSLSDSRLVRQTACLRPLSSDRLLVLGEVPGWDGVYIATGAGRSGIALGPAMGKIVADLITNGSTDIPLDAFAPGRFAP